MFCGGLCDPLEVIIRIFAPQLIGLFDGEPFRYVAVQRIVGCHLIGEHIRDKAALHQFRMHLSRIAEQANRKRFALLSSIFRHFQGLVDVIGPCVEVTCLDAPLNCPWIDFDSDHDAEVQRGRKRLSAAHLSEASRQNDLALQVTAKMLSRSGEKCLISALKDALSPDVYPAAGRHLAIHNQAALLKLPEIFPVSPLWHKVGVCDQHAWRPRMGLEHAHRLPRLHDERFIKFHLLQCVNDSPESLPAASRPSGASINDQIGGILGHFRVKVVHYHAHRGFGLPALGCQLRPPRRTNGLVFV